ncbi:myb/SANT-like DNA-binding domain-containing protein 3 [Procambarus clarkii]|uniref:myb/SANT-like DNA-binding domain-containing protein 3 n=1 Tax=Procambarus clarkii TaxID=6728 RepID=UPI001E674AD1|nr:myb/SANT-like DNA-binding domain-containing protein 3 [Procambarus clarkii]
MNQPASDGRRRIFTEEERLLLRSLVTAHEGILKAQNTDGTSTKERRRQWEKIATSFNNSPTVTTRTAPELRKAWENMKYRAKHALDRQYRTRGDSVGGDSSPPLHPPMEAEGDSPVALLPSQCLETIMLHESQQRHIKMEPDNGEEYDDHEGIPELVQSIASSAVPRILLPVTPPTRTASPASSSSPENGHVRVKRGRARKRDKYSVLCDHDIVLAKKQRELVDLQLEVYNLKKMVALSKLQHMEKAYELDLKHKEEEHSLKMCLMRRAMEK